MNDGMAIISLGGGAGHIVNHLPFATLPGWVRCYHLDTDERMQTLADPIEKIPLGKVQFRGQGSGGEWAQVEKATLQSAKDWLPKIAAAQVVIVVACLGRGTGSGGVQAVSRLLREQQTLALFVTVAPFSFEGHTARNLAEQTIAVLRGHGSAVIPIMHDILYQQFPDPRKANETFNLSDKFLADGIVGLIEILRCREGLIPIDFNSLKTVFSQKNAIGAFGAGFAQGKNKYDEVVANLLKSPLLGGLDYLQKADVIIATLIGGESMTRADLKRCLDNLTAKLNPTAKTLIGANVVPEKQDEVQLTLLALHNPHTQTASLLALKEDKSAVGSKTAIIKVKRRGHHPDRQLLLPLEEPTLSLGIFKEGEPTVVNGQPLDPPTFQRLGMSVDQLGLPVLN